MFKIGDFAKLARVPVRTLRYYDTIGLLKADTIDYTSGYRYYTARQLPIVNRILALKDLGLSLEQIALVIDGNLSDQDLHGMLRLKKMEIERYLVSEEARIGRIETWLARKDEDKETYEIILKNIPPQRVAALSAIAPNEELLAPYFEQLFEKLADYLSNSNIRCNDVGIACYLDNEFTDTNIHIQALIPVHTTHEIDNSEVTIIDLPEMKVASVAFCGGFKQLPDVYATLTQWLEYNHCEISGNTREIHMHDGDIATIEVQLPIRTLDHNA